MQSCLILTAVIDPDAAVVTDGKLSGRFSLTLPPVVVVEVGINLIVYTGGR